MNKILLIISLLAIFFLSCKENTKKSYFPTKQSNKIIKIPKFNSLVPRRKKDLIKYSLLFYPPTYIKLETNSKCLIGNIDKIEIHNNNIFILDKRVSESLFIFDLQGNFVRKIGNKGRGPNEYASINTFSINKEKNQIIIADRVRKSLICYKLSGEFIKSIKMGLVFSDFSYRKGLFVFDIHNMDKKGPYSIAIANSKGEIKRILKTKKQIGRSIGMDNLVSDSNGNIYFKEPFDNIIYKIDPKTKKASRFLTIRINNQKIPIEKFKKDVKLQDFIQEANLEKYTYISPFKGYGFIQNNLFLSISKELKSMKLLYSFKTNKSYQLQALISDDNSFLYDMGVIYPSSSFDDYIISKLNINSYISRKINIGDKNLKNIIKNSNINDNPVLILHRIKEDI